MSVKDITGLLTIIPDKEKPNQAVKDELQAGNVSFRSRALERALYFWNNNIAGSNYQIYSYPWKNGGMMEDADYLNVGHGVAPLALDVIYPSIIATSAAVALSSLDYVKFRATGTVGTVPAANIPRVHAGLAAYDNSADVTVHEKALWGNNIVSASDIPEDYTQIGTVYAHPAFISTGTLTTAVGTNFVTYVNSSFWDQVYVTPTRFGALRIASGADAGSYLVHSVDFTNNRLYLRNLDGTPFVGKAAATVAATELYLGPGRTQYFNETSIIPFSTGTVVTGGRFRPGVARSSFILRVKIEKTGSDESAAAAEQQGSYTLGLKPFTHGLYDLYTGWDYALYSTLPQSGNTEQFLNHTYPYNLTNGGGAANAMLLDEVGQRAWIGVTNDNNDSVILHSRWRTLEGPREVANYLGTAASASFLTPTPVLAAGDIISGGTIGSNRWVYFSIRHATLGNGGLIIIKPDLTTLQYNESSGIPDSNVVGVVADKTRARLFANITTTVSTNVIDDVVGTTFTNVDIGRVIKIDSGADAGTYKIATITDNNTVTVVTLAGGAVSFAGSVSQTGEIGDRLYLFFADAIVGAGKINYMESLAPGTFFTRTVSMTNGATCRGHSRPGENQKVSIDQANGDVYWLSSDTQHQINKYDVLANSHSFIAISDPLLLSPAGGVVQGGANPATNPGTPTIFSAIHVSSKFDEIWVGGDAGSGHFKIVKSTFSTSTIKRYFGDESSTYFSGTPLTTGTGNGVSGLTFGTPTVTLNATGTPFTANDVGKYIIITGASTAANNGYFPITAFNSSSSIGYKNASGSTQAGYAGTFHVVSSVFQRNAGVLTPAASYPRNYWELADGKIVSNGWAGATASHEYSHYSREADAFVYRIAQFGSQGGSGCGRNQVHDSLGWFLDFCYDAGGAGPRVIIGSYEINYQWSGSVWIPREQAYAGTPNKSFADTTNPLCAARPIHSTLDDVLYGVKIGFTKQGGATPANNEFLGRMGQTRTTATDGATSIGTNTFNGSGFVVGDTGRLLRIETGADAGVYRATFVSAGQVTLQTLGGLALVALATAGTLTYTVWDEGTAGSTAGPEDMTVLLADGIGKDNTQDITGFTYEAYHFKTRLHENDEGRKFAVENPLAVPGSLASKVYWETYARASPQYDAATNNHLALPAAEYANGRQVLDGVIEKYLDGSGGKATIWTGSFSPSIWYGTAANNGTLGYSLMVDFGTDVQVGYAVLRLRTSSTAQQLLSTQTAHGYLANVYKATDAGGVPVKSFSTNGTGDTIGGSAPTMTLSDAGAAFVAGDVGRFVTIFGATTPANNGTFPITVFSSGTLISFTNASGVAEAFGSGKYYITELAPRTTGTASLNILANVTDTTALTTGDFLGPISLTPTTPAVGAIVSGASSFADTTNAQFLTSHVGQILKITAGAGADINSYRIIGYTSSSVITVRNLDQTTKTWTVSSATVTYEIRDGVQEDDMIESNLIHRLCVERLLTPNTLQVRTGPNATLTSQNWICVKPSWTKVKRISYSVDAAPPEVKNNGTWLSQDGREAYNLQDVKVFTDFSDLASADRTGRFWKLSASPRFAANATSETHWISDWEFYDVSGKRLATSNYTQVDESRPDVNADFLFNHINRADFIQSANDALTGVGTFNGNVNLGGGNGDTLTLTAGGNAFLGFQIGPSLSDGVLTVSTDTIDSASSNWPLSAMPGRFIRITTGANAGNFYRVSARPSATQITVTTPTGASVSWGGTESSIVFSVHEGINVGGVSPDKFTFLEDGAEFTLATINDTLTTLTFVETLEAARTNKTWEIRRPGYDTDSATSEASKTARLTRPQTLYPLQSGDLCHDAKGTYRLFEEDIGNGFQRANGVIAGGSGVFTGSGFSPDDVGRLLYIVSGTGTQVNNGIYEISVFTSASSITVKNHYTGAAVSFTADTGPVTYQIYGDRRFRLTRFVVGLRA